MKNLFWSQITTNQHLLTLLIQVCDNTKKTPKEPSATTSSHQKKKTKEEILKKINHMHVNDGKSFKQIKDDLVQMQTE